MNKYVFMGLFGGIPLGIIGLFLNDMGLNIPNIIMAGGVGFLWVSCVITPWLEISSKWIESRKEGEIE